MIRTLTLSLLLTPLTIFSQSAQQSLQQQIETLVSGFRGRVGVFVKNLNTGETAAINADTLFPTASMIKVPILIGIMDKIEKGELDYHQKCLFSDTIVKLENNEEDILASFKNDQSIELSKLLMLMLTTSDNTASVWLQKMAGGGTTINDLFAKLGFEHTRVNSRTEGRAEAFRTYGWGVTTPTEMAVMFEKLYRGMIFNKTASARMMRLLGRNYWDEEAMGQLPSDIFIADKVGAVDASRSETLLVAAPHGTYIFSVITKNQTDTSWKSDNEGWVLERKLSRLLWNYFEPGSNWKPIIDLNGNWIREGQ